MGRAGLRREVPPCNFVSAEKSVTSAWGPAQAGRWETEALDRARFQPLYDAPAHLVRRLLQVTSAIYEEEAAPFGLTHAQYAILRVVELSPGLEQREIALAASHDAVTTGKIVQKLEAMGLVRRDKGLRSRRGQAVVLTEAGVAKLEVMNPAIARVQERLMEVFPAEERENVLRILSRLARAENRFNPEGDLPFAAGGDKKG